MTTFWTGAALAADYGQDRVYPLGVATRPRSFLPHEAVVARRRAFDTLNRAISRAVQAQLDDQQVYVRCLAEDDDDDLLMHCGGMECYFCTCPDKPVVVGSVAGLR